MVSCFSTAVARSRCYRHFISLFLLLTSLVGRAGEPTTPIAKLTEFPPPNSAHYLGGELTFVDVINRVAFLRPDRTDGQPKDFQDLPLYITMLPYGSLRYHGASATFSDIPIGTHLHGWFYLGEEGAFEGKEPGYPESPGRAFDSQYSQALRLEDDFSYYQEKGIRWEIVSIDAVAGKLFASAVGGAGKKNQPVAFDYTEATRIWRVGGFAGWDEVKPGQKVLFNLTWATLFGPGRLTDLWLDEESMAKAGEVQKKVNQGFIKLRGMAARIDSVEHQDAGRGIVTATLYAGVDPELVADFTLKGSVYAEPAEPTLRVYGINEASGGIFEIITTENPPPGHSGVSLKFQCGELLEVIRPGRSVRISPGGYERITKPAEEILEPFDIWPLPQKP